MSPPRPTSRRGRVFLVAALAGLALVSAVGAEAYRALGVRRSVRDTAEEIAVRWAQAGNTSIPPEQACRQARELLQARDVDITHAWIEALVRPDPVMAGVDQRVVRIHFVYEPLEAIEVLGIRLQPPRFKIAGEGVVLSNSET